MGTKTQAWFGRTVTCETEALSDGTSGDNTIVAAVAGRRIKVYAIHFNVVGSVNVIWKSGATELTGDMNFQAREGYTNAVTPPAFLLATAAGEALILNLSDNIAVDGWISYWTDDAT